MKQFFQRVFSRAQNVPSERKYGAAPTYLYAPGEAVWSGRDYSRFSDEAYIRNVVAHRCVSLIAQAAASVPYKLFTLDKSGQREEIKSHRLLSLLQSPNPMQGRGVFFESLVSYYLISGNGYVQAAGPRNGVIRELHLLRPDRVTIIAGKGTLPAAYRYEVGNQATDFVVDRVTGRSRVLHVKRFHPLNDWYGLSSIEAAAYSIDQHNEAAAWNQALLQNGARPSGALVVNGKDGPGYLNENQYARLKQQMDEQFSGSMNAGRPLLLEGGLDWKEMSLSPRDMDFIECKHASARDVALAFGVPPQLLGIPGDNTYSNLAEARLALWEQTVLPLVQLLCTSFNQWLVPFFEPPAVLGNLQLEYDVDAVPAFSPRREALWNRLQQADFLTVEEKRRMAGVGEY